MIMILSEDEGQIAIDFLFGLAFFLVALMFTIQFVPGLFTTASYSEEELGIVSYRTASILAEDPGWWANQTEKGTDWELHPNSTQRIGLAMDNNPYSRLTDTPNTLDRDKVIQMMELNESELIMMLGLYENIDGAMVNYSYNFTIERYSQPLSIGAQEIAFGDNIPEGTDIFRTKRIVMISTFTAANFNASELPAEIPPNDKVIINVTGPLDEDMILQITNFNVTGPNPKFLGITEIAPNNTPLKSPDDYTAYKNVQGSLDYILYEPGLTVLNSTDTLRLVIEKEYFSNIEYTLQINFNSMYFQYGTVPPSYNKYATPIYKPADLVVSVWK